ncbi:hypothetical protein SAY87_009557 [Trapa incisa]|uniref:Transcription repressor n=1 Tax=Trapa incisa TaxID=236973 RepID=A0AAN7K160_9MYRT|nr:hypothetical protein SAY87_009557 [Trapa incisa]
MSHILSKNFHLCFSKLKCLSQPPPPPLSSPPSPPHPSRCRRLTPPENHPFAAGPTSVIIKNFNSIYDVTSSENSTTSAHSATSLTLRTTGGTLLSSSSEDSDFAAAATTTATSPPDLTLVYASQRFFISSPGQSNSIIDSQNPHLQPSPPNLAEPPPPPSKVASMGGFTVQKYSSDLYRDFRRSMLEMVEARDSKDLRNDNWDYLHELLLCYLALNPKETHKFIIGAFSDIVIHLMSEPPQRPARPV